MGNGRKINIYEDRWLPGGDSACILSPKNGVASDGIGIVKITSHVHPYGSSMSVEPNVQIDCLSKGVVHGQSTWAIHITLRV